MRLVVFGNNDSFNELVQANNQAEWIHAGDVETSELNRDADAFFNLHENAADWDYTGFGAPVFINSVVQTITGRKNIVRINGWQGFLAHETWEIAGDITEKAKEVLHFINKKIIITADVPGFISGGIIAMIINEAYFAKDDEVSTEDEIDIAMKLGTNYPYGPFEWSRIIGLKNIYTLLLNLSSQNKKYTPSLLMKRLVNIQ